MAVIETRGGAGRAWTLAATGLAGVLLLCVIQGLRPSINVRWDESVSAARRAELEQRYGLVRPAVDGSPSRGYRLTDPSRANIEGLVRDPAVADTHYIHRDHYHYQFYTGPGDVWLNTAFQVLRLDDRRVQAALFVLFGGVALAGLWRLALHRRGLPRPHDAEVSGDRGDPFDRLPSTAPAGGVAGRIAAAGLLPVVIGVPILETWESLLLGIAGLGIVFGTSRPERWRPIAAAGIVVAVVLAKAVLPRADIAEAHNAFLVAADGGPLQQGLPPQVFRSWKSQFEALYPPEESPAPFSWRAHGVQTESLYTTSADAIWRPAKFTRQVDAIDFSSLAEFRGGFANESRDPDGRNEYNFWAGDLRRESMPFYVMYELTPASAGSRLRWAGQVFWERSDGTYEEIVHDQPAARAIRPEDAGRGVYAAFFPERGRPFQFALEPSLTLRLGEWLQSVLTLAGAAGVLAITVLPRWGAALRAAAIFCAGYLLLMWSAPGRLGSSYAPHRGGDDGMVHDGWGRLMAMMAGRGEVAEALKGIEPVYWFTPGTRYVRMVEKLVFGDTNHLYTLALACLPLVIFYLARHFLGTRRAWLVAAVFCLLPVGNLSFVQYITNARLGYGEALGGGLFLLGLTLLLRSQPAWGGQRNLGATMVAGGALAASMMIRPNFAFAVVWLGAACAWVSLRGRDAAALGVLAAGLAAALWMPFHNWAYGGEPYLISRSGATVSVPLGAGDYAAALGDLVRGDTQTRAVEATSQQVQGWLGRPAFVSRAWLEPVGWIAHAARLLALAATCAVVVQWAATRFRVGGALAVVAIASLLAHLPMLFIFSTEDRYAMLGWDLALLVAVVWGARAMAGEPRRVDMPAHHSTMPAV